MWAQGGTRHRGPHTQITRRHAPTLTDKQVASLLHESGCGQRWKLALFGLRPPTVPSKTILWGHLTGAAGERQEYTPDSYPHPPTGHTHTQTKPNGHIRAPWGAGQNFGGVTAGIFQMVPIMFIIAFLCSHVLISGGDTGLSHYAKYHNPDGAL